ncbi:MAG: type IV secretion system protein [Rickettsiaceae bacterium]|nr:type IV secretion system protein [Rickettsiaceae bacterium]
MAIFSGANAIASYGNSCVSRDNLFISPDAITDLEANDIYSFVKSIIDIENCGPNYSGGCSTNDRDRINICVKTDQSSDTEASASNSAQTELLSQTIYRLGQLTTHPTVESDPNIANIFITSGVIDDKLCVVMPTSYGYAPITCREAKSSASSSIRDYSECSNISPACDVNFNNSPESATKNNFYGNVVQCVYETLDLMFMDSRTCNHSDLVAGSSTLEAINTTIGVKPFAEFYTSLKKMVGAMLVLYMVFQGMRMALHPEEVSVHSLFMTSLKMVFVIYFSIGIPTTSWFSAREKNTNGITSLVLPFTIGFANEMTSYYVNNATNNNLCRFSREDYNAGYEYYSIWDSLDCRINTYLGTNPVIFNDDQLSYLQGNNSGYTGNIYPNDLPLLSAIFRFLMSGEILVAIILVMMIFMMIFMTISILLGMITSILMIYILAYIAPIFVPMSLFKRTYGFFNAWYDLLISMSVQPIIFVGFGAFFMAVIDSVMFQDCTFEKYKEPNSGKYLFSLNTSSEQADVDSCDESIGMTLAKHYTQSWAIPSYTYQTHLFFSTPIILDFGNLHAKSWTLFTLCFFMHFLIPKIFQLSQSLAGGMSLASTAKTIQSTLNEINKATKSYKQAGQNVMNAAKNVYNK